jgi:CheY-like chemotaxis protein
MIKSKVLVADDDRDAADTLAALLRQEGHDARVAYDGEETIAAALAFEPDVLILDLAMPALDGISLARQLRTMPQFQRKCFIACTGHSDQGHLDKASRAQFDEYLIKPCRFDVLRAILGEWHERAS